MPEIANFLLSKTCRAVWKEAFRLHPAPKYPCHTTYTMYVCLMQKWLPKCFCCPRFGCYVYLHI